MSPLLLFWLVFKASLLSTSGLGNLPQLYDDMIKNGWADQRHFAEALAVGQISPGPSGLWVVSLGYLLDGPRGALLSALAISIPPFVVMAFDRLYQHIGEHPAMRGFVQGLSLAVVGNLVVALIELLRANDAGPFSLIVVSVAVALGMVQRIPILAILILAALAGALIYR